MRGVSGRREKYKFLDKNVILLVFGYFDSPGRSSRSSMLKFLIVSPYHIVCGQSILFRGAIIIPLSFDSTYSKTCLERFRSKRKHPLPENPVSLNIYRKLMQN